MPAVGNIGVGVRAKHGNELLALQTARVGNTLVSCFVKKCCDTLGQGAINDTAEDVALLFCGEQ